MGRWMARAGRELLSEADALIPCRCTGAAAGAAVTNQSGALARVIARQTGVKVAADALRRVRPTQQQIGLSRSQRASNVQGAFKVAPDRTAEIQGRRLILIDDVLTSGATTDAARGAAPRQGRFGRRAGVSPGLWTLYKAPYNQVLPTRNFRKVLATGERDMTVAIEIYTRPGCGYCGAAKSLLTAKKPRSRNTMSHRSGASSANVDRAGPARPFRRFTSAKLMSAVATSFTPSNARASSIPCWQAKRPIHER